ncbi:hypothetical protein MRB53_037376 [Persea americana]|nr:hypothetical protein MRB53_037376 [Persea americana]
MFPTDASFKPYLGNPASAKPDSTPTSATSALPVSHVNGRIFVLRFSSSSDRHFFWLQSKAQESPNKFSTRDVRIGKLVDQLLQGDDLQDLDDTMEEDGEVGGDDDDADQEMEDADASTQERHGSGGGGANPTGGDTRQEGEGSREGGADGGRA